MNTVFKNIRHIELVTLLTFSFLLSTAFASGIVHVRVGESLELQPSNAGGKLEYSWILKKGEEIIPQGKSGATNSSAKVFQHVFTEPGEYEVRLLITDSESGATQSTTTIVKADITNPNFEKKQAVFTTLPPLNDEGKLVVDPSSPEVTFFPGGAGGNPSEYWIDTDINEDADGDGITDNDVENKTHSSFFTGQAWSHIYDTSQAERTAQVTVKYATGETVSKTLDIVFDTGGLNAQKALPLKAILSSLPRANQDGFIYLPGNEGNVTFFAGNSEGSIVEYRMDKNVLFDTNGDGKQDNDIDNREHNSFLTGSSWTTNFKKEWGDVVIELLVVNDENKGSKVQRKIVFDDTLSAQQSDSGAPLPALPQRLIISQEEVFVGESVDFIVLGFAEGAQITWDFDGDGVTEYEGIRTHNTYQYKNDGVFPVKITAQKDEEMLGEIEKIVTVKSNKEREIMTSAPTAEFSSSVSANTVLFQDNSFADKRLINTDLLYSWDFGDGGTSSEADPEHVFVQTGPYTIVLTVTDSVGRSATTAENIVIESVVPGSISDDDPTDTGSDQSEADGEIGEPDDTEDPAGSESVKQDEKKGIGWLWWILIIFLILPLVLVATYLVFRKIQYPDLSFEEIIAEDLDRIRHKKHEEVTQVTQEPVAEDVEPVAEDVEPVAEDVEPVAEDVEPVAEVVVEDAAPAEKEEIEHSSAEAPVADTSEPPAWLKKEEEVVSEISGAPGQEEKSSKEEEKIPEVPDDSKGEVPDWLKDSGQEEVAAPTTTPAEAPEVEETGVSKEAQEESPVETKDGSVPDWLKEGVQTPVESSDPAPETPKEAQEKPAEDTAPEATEGDLPDWMK